jgi:RNA polymerase sigma-70 factor (ECF subfamily)
VKKDLSGHLESVAQANESVLQAYTSHKSSLKRFIGRFMRSSADIDDIAQEAFLRAYVVERSRPIEQPKSFLFRIAKHLALSQLTRKARQITDYMEDSEDSTVVWTECSAEDEISARQTLGLHCEAVAELAPQCREVYLLRKVHGLSHKEIAAQMGIAVSTVEKHLMKAVEQCERYIADRTVARGGRGGRGGSQGKLWGER